MNNVVAFRAKPKPINIEPEPAVNELSQPVKDQIWDIYLWAQAQGIDTDSLEWQYEMATVTTLLNGMVFRNANR
jgi:hypothetical protein